MEKFFNEPFAISGDKSAVPNAVDVDGFVSYPQGYGFDYQRPKTDPNSKPIERLKMNQLFYDVTTALKELQSQGVPDFITSALNGGTPYSYSENNVVRYTDGELYVSLVDSNVALPTDATKWAPYSAIIKGDAFAMRVIGADGNPIELQDQFEKVDLEFARPAYSLSAAAIQTGPLVIDLTSKLKNTGNIADAAYNDAVIANALAGLPNGAEIEFPSRGLAYVTGGFVVASKGVSLRGHNSGSAYDSFWLRSTPTAVSDMFKLTGYGFHADEILVVGPSDLVSGFGNDTTVDGFNFEPDATDMDAVFTSCGLWGFRDCMTVKNKPARNIKASLCLFSGSSRAFSYTDATSSNGRDIELYMNRYHGIGREVHARSAVVYINPASNVRTVMMKGGFVDFSVEVFRGYAAGGEIEGITSKGAQRGYADLDSTGNTQPTPQRGMSILNARYYYDTTFGLTLPNNALTLKGSSAFYSVDGFISYGSLGHGVYLETNNPCIANTIVHNASQLTNNTYSGYYVAAATTSAEFGGSNAYKQGIQDVPANKAKYGFENLGSDTLFKSELLCHNVTAGIEYFIDPAKKSFGPDPRSYANFKRSARGTAAPVAGAWNQGDMVVNTNPTAGGVSYWECTAGGTPGTWKTVSLSA